MSRRRARTFWRSFPRQLTVGVCIVVYLLATVGFPVREVAAKNDSVPFPCQHHACGCKSAEECWRSCCCFTVEERWAWAREHNVEPPAYAERPASHPHDAPEPPAPKGWRTVRVREQAEENTTASPACAECAGQTEPKHDTCCSHGEEHPSACCSPTHSVGESAKEPSQRPAAESGLRWVTGAAALGCRGLSTLWIASGAVIPAPLPVAWEPCNTSAELITPNDESPLGLPLIPPDPPPRSFVS